MTPRDIKGNGSNGLLTIIFIWLLPLMTSVVCRRLMVMLSMAHDQYTVLSLISSDSFNYSVLAPAAPLQWRRNLENCPILWYHPLHNTQMSSCSPHHHISNKCKNKISHQCFFLLKYISRCIFYFVNTGQIKVKFP